MHRVAVLALPGVVLFDLSIPLQLLGRTLEDFAGAPDRDGYDVRVCAIRPGRVESSTGPPLVAEHGLAELADADTVVVPGFGGLAEPLPAAVRAALRSGYERGGRVRSRPPPRACWTVGGR